MKVYNLSAGKSLPAFLSDSKKKELRRTDDGYRRRIQLLQDFDFDTACQRVRFARDGLHLAATGTYPPCIKMFDVRELSLKFERRLDAEVVQFQVNVRPSGALALHSTLIFDYLYSQLSIDRTAGPHMPLESVSWPLHEYGARCCSLGPGTLIFHGNSFQIRLFIENFSCQRAHARTMQPIAVHSCMVVIVVCRLI